ncbi:MAG TPA: DUF1552 domain-containing protein [Bryobacteraceae bacterium]|jgi:hypothetical protein
MFNTKKHISRRTVLKGSGVSLALPFLSAMVPASTALAQTAASPKMRAGFFYIPHGAIMFNTKYGLEWDRWTPSGSGADFKLKEINSPLEPFKKYVTSFGNMENAAAAGSVHVRNPATWLSATLPQGNNMSTTLDQVMTKFISQDTQFPSLELSSETTVQVAAGNGGPFTTLSFRDEHTPLPMEYNPRKVFLRLFGEGDSPQERVAMARQKNSILDMILDRVNSLKGDLGSEDKAILDGYLENVREVERQAKTPANPNLSRIKIPNAPIGELEDFTAQVKVMYDLLALSYQADLTRVATYVTVAEGTNRSYPFLNVTGGFHPISHHSDDLDRIKMLVQIQKWHMQMFADFLKKMADTPDGQGSLLDHSIFMYGSNMSNSNLHSNYPVPNLIVGGGNGKLKQGGQHLMLAEKTPLANLHLTLLQKMGHEQDHFGDSTGTIAGV